MLETKRTAPPKIKAPMTIAAKRKARKNMMRRVGNILIVTGLLLMIGVGGYLGWQSYSNDQTTQAIEQAAAKTDGLDIAPPEQPTAAITRAAEATSAAVQGTVVPTPTDGGQQLAVSGAATAAVPAAAPSTDDTNNVVINNKPLPLLNAGSLTINYGSTQASEDATHLVIPSVGIDSKVVPVDWGMLPGKDGQDSPQWKVAEYAVGHHAGSANPGQVGNMVMSGHVDWKGEVFKNLYMVKRGDQVYVSTPNRQYLYIIQKAIIVPEDGPGVTDDQRRANAHYMDPTPDQTLTMITCYPYGIDTSRLIVIAKPYDSGLPQRPDLVLN